MQPAAPIEPPPPGSLVRGCLTFLVLVVATAALAGWFLLPVAAGVLIADRLHDAGFSGTDTRITVIADPPLALATLHADRVHVTSTDATFHGLLIGSVDLTVSDVRFVERTAGAVTGTLSDLRIGSGLGGDWSVASARLSGTSTDISITLDLSLEDAERMAAAAVERQLGERPTSVTLVAPDMIRFEAGGTAAGGRLVVDDQARLVFRPGGAAGSLIGSIVLISPGPDTPIRLSSVVVRSAGITLVGRFEASFLPS